MCEVIYVLEGRYDVPREDIKKALTMVGEKVVFEEENVFRLALEAYVETPKIDISDCILYAMNRIYDIPVFTFDKKLNKKIECQGNG